MLATAGKQIFKDSGPCEQGFPVDKDDIILFGFDNIFDAYEYTFDKDVQFTQNMLFFVKIFIIIFADQIRQITGITVVLQIIHILLKSKTLTR